MKSYDGGASKRSLEIQFKARLKKRFPNQVPSKFPRLMMIECLTLILKREKVLHHLTRIQLVDSVAKNIMVIGLLGGTIAFC